MYLSFLTVLTSMEKYHLLIKFINTLANIVDAYHTDNIQGIDSVLHFLSDWFVVLFFSRSIAVIKICKKIIFFRTNLNFKSFCCFCSYFSMIQYITIS